jgi:hypothetical protein
VVSGAEADDGEGKAGTTDGFYPAVQAAENQRSHGHNDSGSFIVSHDGNPVFIDLVPEAYSVKRFGPDRYSLWTMQSAFHILPTVGGVMQSSANPQYSSARMDLAATWLWFLIRR